MSKVKKCPITSLVFVRDKRRHSEESVSSMLQSIRYYGYKLDKPICVVLGECDGKPAYIVRDGIRLILAAQRLRESEPETFYRIFRGGYIPAIVD